MEKFFRESSALDYAELIEFALRTYPYDTLCNLDFRDGVLILSKGFERERRKELWEMYCCMYPLMSSENFISFEDFQKQATTVPKRQSKEQIMTDVKDIISMTV